MFKIIMQLQAEMLFFRLPVRYLDSQHFEASAAHRDRRIFVNHADIRIDLLNVFQEHHFQIFLLIIDMRKVDLQFFQLIFVCLAVQLKLTGQILRTGSLREQAVKRFPEIIIRVLFTGRNLADHF